MKDIALSPHFSLYELANTSHDDMLEENRMWAWDGKAKLKELATEILEPIRMKFGRPVIVTSGARCPGLNTLINGAANSQHVSCEAADIIVDGLDCREGSTAVFDWIYKESGLQFGQVIHEFKSGIKDVRPDKIWIHISLGEPYRDKGDCMEVLTFKDGFYRFVKKG